MPFTDAIPSDYDGMMGVPITFLDKYNPDQFEIIGNSEWTTLDEDVRSEDARRSTASVMKSDNADSRCKLASIARHRKLLRAVGYP